MSTSNEKERKVSDLQLVLLEFYYEGRIDEVLKQYNLEKIEDMTADLAAELISQKSQIG